MAENRDQGNGQLERDAIRAMRRSYGEGGLESLPTDPFAAFHQWLAEAAQNSFIVEANAMVLSTLGTDSAGADAITTRTVLLKDVSQGGFTFFTNYGSRKGQAIELHSQVTLLFPWFAMERQLIISGFAEKISAYESEEYFATRPWSSQIGAWASAQSAPLSSREELEQRFKGASEKWPEGAVVPCPPHWGGYRVLPISIEFWQGRYSRLHDRLRYERPNTDSNWEVGRYYP
ncbi:MAG: pyridoxamine 5'-phosphate oxidase [Candidatus Planktophila sp.]|jgi:pyridoxamine 5'-phosphate oxidase|tara:strand:+ start:2595 stop:3290 length:696 start_codon:yes stop_codon:yes gene_type:complete